MLAIPFTENKDTEISNAVQRLAALMQEHGISLQEAHLRFSAATTNAEGSNKQLTQVDWKKLVDQYLVHKGDNRKSTLGDTRRRLEKLVDLFDSAPRPIDGRSLFHAYAKSCFQRCPAGGQGRRRHLDEISAFLDWAIRSHGLPGKWKPLRGPDRDELIGVAETTTSHQLTPPIKPDQLATLLDGLYEQRKDLWLAVALIGLFGLRPAELAVLSVDDGKLYVGSQVKRNLNTKNKNRPPRRVIALEIQGRVDGQRALQAYESGSVKLPQPVLNAIDTGDFKAVGQAVAQLLRKNSCWTQLKQQINGLVPYSLRHGYAWRAHKHYSRALSVRDAAALMGHTPVIHNQHYGRWTDEQGLEDAVAGLF